MDTKNNPEMKKEDREQIVELGSDVSKNKNGNIYTLTIIGQVEGHQVLPDTVKSSLGNNINVPACTRTVSAVSTNVSKSILKDV